MNRRVSGSRIAIELRRLLITLIKRRKKIEKQYLKPVNNQ